MAFGAAGNIVQKSSYAYSWDEIQRMLTLARATDLTSYTLLVTLAYTGRRVGEVVGNLSVKERQVRAYWVGADGKKDKLIWERVPVPTYGLRPCDIDFERGVISFTIEKKFSRKNLPGQFQQVKRLVKSKVVAGVVLSTLQDYLTRKQPEIGPLDRVFPFTPRWAHRLISGVAEQANISGRERMVHALRHGFGLRWVAVGQTPSDLLALQEQMEHSNIDTTMGYLRFGKPDAKGMLEKL